MKTRYYRHNDPRRGFKLNEQLQIATKERIAFSGPIEKINRMYSQCADKHSQSFLAQPNENQVLQKVVFLLVLPLLLCYTLQSLQYLVSLYLISLIIMGACIWQYMGNINQCRSKFEEANQELRVQFCRIQKEFEEKWVGYSLVLMREWNQFNETCTQYIEIQRKQGAEVPDIGEIADQESQKTQDEENQAISISE